MDETAASCMMWSQANPRVTGRVQTRLTDWPLPPGFAVE